MVKKLKKALLIFAKEPLPGKVKTRLVPPLLPEEAAELYERMLGDILAKTNSLPAIDRYLYFYGSAGGAAYFNGMAMGIPCRRQQGNDLGERMAGALDDIFAEGHGSAALIGSDSPDLPVGFIEEAFTRLEEGECETVLGPAEDGGYYLIAMNKPHPELFAAVPWSSSSVISTTLGNAADAGITVSLLPQWHDLDTASDLNRPELLLEGNDAKLTREFLKKRIDTTHKGD